MFKAISKFFRRKTMLAEVFPKWESNPWDLDEDAAEPQEQGFHERALKLIRWVRAPWSDFPESGIFSRDRDWFVSNDIAYYATFDGEDLILIQNTWHGFPDPPEWGLASRPAGQINVPWSLWGYFPDLPPPWKIPREM